MLALCTSHNDTSVHWLYFFAMSFSPPVSYELFEGRDKILLTTAPSTPNAVNYSNGSINSRLIPQTIRVYCVFVIIIRIIFQRILKLCNCLTCALCAIFSLYLHLKQGASSQLKLENIKASQIMQHNTDVYGLLTTSPQKTPKENRTEGPFPSLKVCKT